MENSKRERGRSRGRARCHGRGRGRGRGRACDGEANPPAGLSDIDQVQQNTISKRKLAKMSVEDQAEYEQRQAAMQCERTLLPDAPPRKRARQQNQEESCASESSLLCNWTTGELLQEDSGILRHSSPTRPSSPSSVNSIDVSITEEEVSHVNLIRFELSPTPQSQPLAVPASSSSNQTCAEEFCVPEWSEECASIGGDAKEVGITSHTTDYSADEPAYFPFNLDPDVVNNVVREDNEADKLLRGLLSDNCTFDWTNNPESFLGQKESFIGPSGPTFKLNPTDRPLDIFLRFFDDEIFNLLVTEANRNCSRIKKTRFSEQSRLNRLSVTDRSEMGIFIAVTILQGMLLLPAEKDYFSENGYLTLKYFKTLMTYNRFVLMKKMLHFSDDDARPDLTVAKDKLRKLGPFLNLLSSKFRGLYLPSRHIAIDESLLKWHGHLSYAQRISTKAAKVGIKTYELCESSTGYCWSFFIYTGKGHTHDHNEERTNTDGQQTHRVENAAVIPTNLTAQTVLDLVRPLLNRGHTLVMNNFYNSPLLARYLKTQHTDCFGTLRLNREFVPAAMKNATKTMFRPGEMIQSYCHDLCVTVWRDLNIVAMISTCHGGEAGGKEKYVHYKYKPQVILDYNLSMGGVDKKDQLLSAHPIERVRNKTWYKKVFRRLLNVTILNSYIIYKIKHPHISQRQFRMTLTDEMIAMFKPPKVARPLDNTVREVMIVRKGSTQRPILTGNHFVGQGPSKYLKCVYCRNCRTRYICKQCNVSLCLEICFEQYHTVV